MGRADQLRAELDVAVLEDKLVKAKEGNTSPAKLAELKNQVRAARQAFREQREAEAADDGTARPAAVKATASTKGAK